MLSEIQALRRSIHYSSLAATLISLTLMLAVITLAVISIVVLMTDDTYIEPQTPPRHEEDSCTSADKPL